MSINLSFILDIVILLLLAATVFYTARLSYFMSHFRQGRHEMGKLLADLSRQVTQAETAMAGMRQVAEKSGAELQEIINESKFLSDELRFMNESGDNLANRLEKLADRHRELVGIIDGVGGNKSAPRPRSISVPPPSFLVPEEFTRTEKPAPQKVKESVAAAGAESRGGFAIRDPDFDAEEADDIYAFERESDPFLKDTFPDDQGAGLLSQAEKDLYDALQRGRQTKKSGYSR